jgi:protocatechuate 3,4-dioxygenase beta subunit
MNSPTSRRSFVQKYLVLPLAAFVAACTGRTASPTPPAAPVATATTPATATTIPPTATTALALADPSATAVAPAATNTAAPAASATTLPTLVPTPACGDDDDEPTIAQTEGPYYTPNTPERTSFLEAGITGTRMVVSGQVLSTDCQPIAAALIDFWHCDDAGIYDNAGYRLRGHQFTDEAGRYTLETIMPGLYPGRTRHFHVKVQAPNQPVLTTQLYFPDEPDNTNDGIFDNSLILDIAEATDGVTGTFNFVLAV